MKKILMYPGAFNPPHYGHVSTLETALHSERFDEVWVIPSGRREDKTISTEFKDRKNLGNIFVEFMKTKVDVPIKLVTDELDDVEGRYTHEVLKRIKSEYGTDVTQLIGVDGLLHIQQGSHADELVKDKFIMVINRAGYELPKDFTPGENIRVLKDTEVEISSTKIREMIHDGNAQYKFFVPPGIADYIDEHHPY